MENQSLVEKNKGALVENGTNQLDHNVFSLEEIKEARSMSEIALLVNNKKVSVLDMLYELRLQHKKTF
jgi:hypothetical protein